MKNRFFTLLIFLFCFNNIIYSQNKQIDIDNNMLFIKGQKGNIYFEYDTSKILISFKDGITKYDKKKWLDNTKLFKPHDEKNELTIPNLTVAYFNHEINSNKNRQAIINTLVENEAVSYCSPYMIGSDKSRRSFSNKIFVKLHDLSELEILKCHLAKFNIKSVNNYKWDNTIIEIEIDKSSIFNALEISTELEKTNLFQFAQPDFIYEMELNTNDPYFKDQWALKNTGQDGGTIGADIKIESAWNFTKGSSLVKIAVLDCGVDISHPDLDGCWYLGYDATGLGSAGVPNYDIINNYHGTLCAGLIFAQTDNNIGIAGVSPNCKLISVRIGTTNILGTLTNTSTTKIADGINYAFQTAYADILSNSWNDDFDNVIEISIKNAVNNGRNGKGCLVFFAAGNDNSSVSFPASLSEVIAVGATGNMDYKASFSNYGENLDLSAPGLNIISTDVSGIYGANASGDYHTDSGTSFSCPIAAGVMGLILSINPYLTQLEARRILESTCDKVGGYTYYSDISGQPNGTWSSALGYGRINAYKAVLKAKLPDLIPVDQSLSTYLIQSGSSLTAYCAEKNLGPVPAGSNVVSIHISSDNILTPGQNGDRYISEISIPGVSANSISTTYPKSISIPSDVPAGNYFLFFSADGGQAVEEIFEDNNFASVQLTVTDAPTLSPPRNLSVSAGDTQAFLTWSAPSTGSPISYTVYRSTSENGTYTALTPNTTALSYTSTGLTNGTTYWFYVIANYSTGSSSPSNKVSAVPTQSSTVANDEPCNATPLAVGSSCYFVTKTLIGATKSTQIPDATCDQPSNVDVWFSFTIPSGTFSIHTYSISISSNDCGLAIYTGSCTSLTERLCIPNGSSLQSYMPWRDNIDLSAYAGQTGYIRIWEYGTVSQTGDFQICIYGENSGGNCIITSIDPSSIFEGSDSFSTTPGSDDIIINAQPYCDFSVSESCSWLTVSPMNGSANSVGQAFLNYSITENTSTSSRQCTFYVNGSPITITQDGIEINNDDFYITNATISSSAIVAGAEIDVSCNQCYSGDVSQDNMSYCYVGYYLSSNTSFSKTQDLFLNSDGSGIGSDDPCNDEFDHVTIPNNTPGGIYYILFVADYDDRFDESNENNNVAYVRISITGSALDDDIYVNNLSVVNDYVIQGGNLNFKYDLCYSGTALSNNLGDSRISFYISKDNILNTTTDITIGSALETVGSDIPLDVIIDVRDLPSELTPGRYYLFIEADSEKKIYEVNENNNIQYTQFTIVSTPSGDDFYTRYLGSNDISVCAGDTIEITCFQCYLGLTLDTDMSSSYVGYYWSSNSTFEPASDLYLESDASGLGSDDPANEESEHVVIPPYTTPGTYYILFVADYDERFDESNENNNVVYARITVINNAPTANAGSDQTVNEGSLVTLNGTASDPEGNPLTCNWTAPEGIFLSDSTSLSPTFAAPQVNETTHYTFTLVVNDGTQSSAPDTVAVTVVNVLPRITQVIDLSKGWNIISFNICPDSLDLKKIFEPLINDNALLKVQDESGNTIVNLGLDREWVNNIGEMSLTEGYKVKVCKSSQLIAEGAQARLPLEIPLKTGWNIIGYPLRNELNALMIIEQLIDRETLHKVQDESGNSIEDRGLFGGWTNSIGSFKPGEGYRINVTKDDTIIVSVEPNAHWQPGISWLDSRDGNDYKTIQVGSQVWMAENLAYLPSVSGQWTPDSEAEPFMYVYDYDSTDVEAAKATANYSTYGVLYNWPAAMTACPEGWHLPSDSEWTTLTDYLINNGYGYEGSGDGIAKSMAATTNWNSYSTPGTPGNDPASNNSSGFSGLPGGFRESGGVFYVVGDTGLWWSSTEYSSSGAWQRHLINGNHHLSRAYHYKETGFSVRCLRDY